MLAASWKRIRSVGASLRMAAISASGSSRSARMKSVILPGLVLVERRQRPSTVRSRGSARASTRTMSLRHQAGSARTSSGLIAPQKNYVAIETIHSL